MPVRWLDVSVRLEVRTLLSVLFSGQMLKVVPHVKSTYQISVERDYMINHNVKSLIPENPCRPIHRLNVGSPTPAWSLLCSNAQSYLPFSMSIPFYWVGRLPFAHSFSSFLSAISLPDSPHAILGLIPDRIIKTLPARLSQSYRTISELSQREAGFIRWFIN